MVKADKIHSLDDIKMEKLRLRLEIMKTEESIHSGYREILQALTFKNIATTVISDVSASSSVLTKMFAFGKAVMARQKKKKHDRLRDTPDDFQS
jgi:hypothetical protein